MVVHTVTTRPERVKYRINSTEDICPAGLLHSPNAPHCSRQNCHGLLAEIDCLSRKTGRTNNSLSFAIVPDLLHCNNLEFVLIFCVVWPEHVVSPPKQVTTRNKILLLHHLSHQYCVYVLLSKTLVIHPKTVHFEMVFHSPKDCPPYNGFSFTQRLSTLQWFFIHPKTIHRTSFSTLPTVLYCQSTLIHTRYYFIHPSFSLSSLPSSSLCFSFYDSLRRIYSPSFSLRVQTIVTVFLQLLRTQLV